MKKKNKPRKKGSKKSRRSFIPYPIPSGLPILLALADGNPHSMVEIKRKWIESMPPECISRRVTTVSFFKGWIPSFQSMGGWLCSGLIRNMERDGFITQQRTNGLTRPTACRITDKGKAHLKKLQGRVQMC